MREKGSLVTLACWWVQHPLLLLGVHLCGGNGERSIGGSPVLGGGFCCHPFPGAKLSVWVYVHGVALSCLEISWFSFLHVLAASFDIFLSI